MTTQPETYTDEATGISITVEREPPYHLHPRVSMHIPEDDSLSYEVIGAIVHLLIAQIKQAQESESHP